MKIVINNGHTLTGKGTGAVGVVKETDKNREVGNLLIKMLKEKHTVIDATVDKSNNDLADICAIENKHSNVDVFLSIHLNSYDDASANGVETFSLSNSGKGAEYRNKIQKELVNAIGWRDRGCKTANFYVLKNTKAPAILVELGFCSNRGDMDKWNTDKIAKALYKSLTGTDYVGQAPAPDNNNGTKFRVVVGTYANRDNAVAQQNKLKNAGFDSFLVAYNG